MKVGVIGLGNIGGTLARHWSRAGHEVLLSSLRSEKHADLARELGAPARLVSPEEAAREGEVILLSIPLGEVPRLSPALRQAIEGKIVIDTGNPYPERDGKVAEEVIREGLGTGLWTARQLQGARIVRGFNSVPAHILQTEAHRTGDLVGVPLASDDPEALRTAVRLVCDAGFGPVVVGALRRAKDFDRDTPAYGSGASTCELKALFGMQQKTA